jgi:hypothetical protein
MVCLLVIAAPGWGAGCSTGVLSRPGEITGLLVEFISTEDGPRLQIYFRRNPNNAQANVQGEIENAGIDLEIGLESAYSSLYCFMQLG